jgi:hypothetical protein
MLADAASLVPVALLCKQASLQLVLCQPLSAPYLQHAASARGMPPSTETTLPRQVGEQATSGKVLSAQEAATTTAA